MTDRDDHGGPTTGSDGATDGRGRAPRVVVSNVFADDNRGGAAITAATLDAVRAAAPDADLTLVTTRGSLRSGDRLLRHTRAAFPDARVVPAPFRSGGRRTLLALVRSCWALIAPRSQRAPALAAIRHADLVVSKGGHVFIEREGLPGVLGLWFTAFALVYASRLGIPNITFATSVGPFHTWLSAAANGYILRRTSAVLARDPRSAAAARELVGDRTTVVEVPDSAFAMEPPSDPEMLRLQRRFGLETLRYGVFTVRGGKGSGQERERLIRSLALAAAALLQHERLDQILIVVQVHGDQASDLPDARRFLELAHDDRVRLIVEDLTPAEFVALYGGASFVVGCRMHSTIFSMVAGTPAIGIALSGQKVVGVFEQLGLADRVIDREELEAADLVARLDRLLDDPVAERRRTQRAAAEARARTDDAVQLLRALLDDRRTAQPAGHVRGRRQVGRRG